MQLAVDDMGAGYSGLSQIMAVHPRYLKLDRSLVQGIDVDKDRAALVGALADYATRVGSLLVAEGMESAAELHTLIELGVPLAQGFYLARPAPPWPSVAAALSRRAEKVGYAVRRAPRGSASSARPGSTTTSLHAARSSG
jgi:EAL domain-containing protein (putative c-di-GMP-specific phosphodiesterase class I)